jgi:hypothetical protein
MQHIQIVSPKMNRNTIAIAPPGGVWANWIKSIVGAGVTATTGDMVPLKIVGAREMVPLKIVGILVGAVVFIVGMSVGVTVGVSVMLRGTVGENVIFMIVGDRVSMVGETDGETEGVADGPADGPVVETPKVGLAVAEVTFAVGDVVGVKLAIFPYAYTQSDLL